MYAAMIALEMTYTPCARNSKGLGGRLTETELRGPNCERDKESSRPPRDHSGTESDPIQNEETEPGRTAPDGVHDAGAGQPPPRHRRQQYYFKFLQ